MKKILTSSSTKTYSFLLKSQTSEPFKIKKEIYLAYFQTQDVGRLHRTDKTMVSWMAGVKTERAKTLSRTIQQMRSPTCHLNYLPGWDILSKAPH